jgi:sigma-B regulation protein RsbU (phosphoserine phosphatase)
MWAMMLADVSGHGAAAAMEGAQFDAILRTYRGDEPPGGPAGVLTYANRHFFSRRQRQHFLTVFAALFRPQESRLDYVCAGHPPALLRRGADMHWLGESDAGIPLGVLRDHRWDNASIALENGDVLLVYTDGVVEARNAQGEMFGRERLAALLAGFTDARASEIRDSLVAAVQEHQGSIAGADDQTLIVLRVHPDGGSAALPQAAD